MNRKKKNQLFDKIENKKKRKEHKQRKALKIKVFNIDKFELENNAIFLLGRLPIELIRIVYDFVNFDITTDHKKNLEWNRNFRFICHQFYESITTNDAITFLFVNNKTL